MVAVRPAAGAGAPFRGRGQAAHVPRRSPPRQRTTVSSIPAGSGGARPPSCVTTARQLRREVGHLRATAAVRLCGCCLQAVEAPLRWLCQPRGEPVRTRTRRPGEETLLLRLGHHPSPSVCRTASASPRTRRCRRRQPQVAVVAEEAQRRVPAAIGSAGRVDAIPVDHGVARQVPYAKYCCLRSSACGAAAPRPPSRVRVLVQFDADAGPPPARRRERRHVAPSLRSTQASRRSSIDGAAHPEAAGRGGDRSTRSTTPCADDGAEQATSTVRADPGGHLAGLAWSSSVRRHTSSAPAGRRRLRERSCR